MLGLAKRTGARMLLTSTSEVYGDPKESPQKETYWGHVNPIGPRACYDEGKRVAETMMYVFRCCINCRIDDCSLTTVILLIGTPTKARRAWRFAWLASSILSDLACTQVMVAS